MAQLPGPAEEAYRRFVQMAQVRALVPDHLVSGEPYLGLNAIVLDRDEDHLLRSLTESFASALHRLARDLKSDVPALVEMGFPWVAAELLAAEEPRVPLIGRFDFVRDRGGHWWLLEFNADTPSGFREAMVVDSLVHRMLPGARGLARPNRGLARKLVRAFGAAVAVTPTPAVGLLTSASELEDLAQMAFTRELLRMPLDRVGCAVVLGDIHNVRGTRSGVTLCSQRVGALYRCFPFETMLGTPAFSAIFEAVQAGQLVLLNGLYGLLLQNKGLLAALWEQRSDPAFAASERAAIDCHLPPTWWLERAPPGVRRESLVAKQVFGREGEEVFFGEDLSVDEWGDLGRRQTYVAQRRIEVLQADAVVPTSMGPQIARGTASVGSFAVNGRWAGYYTRFGGRIITSRARWFATFADSEAAG